MDALILAAGEGIRLLPLTSIRPKPLFPILNQPILELTFDYLARFSIERVILNTHHLASQIGEFVEAQKKIRAFELETRFEPQILNTGGGIANTRDFFKSDPFVVINGDILTDIDLLKAAQFHQTHNGPVTLILHDYPEFNRTAVDGKGRIRQFRQSTDEGLAFTGIHILNREIFNVLPSSGNHDIIPIYQQMIHDGTPVWGYISQGHYWRDIGTPRSYLKVHEELLSTPTPTPPLPPLMPATSSVESGRVREGREILVHPKAIIEEGVEFSGWACIGQGCLLKKGCRIRDSVLWENIVVETNVSISKSIIGKQGSLNRDCSGETVA
jgi:mannose-1-phosphate guanylyltransferase